MSPQVAWGVVPPLLHRSVAQCAVPCLAEGPDQLVSLCELMGHYCVGGRGMAGVTEVQ